MLQASIAVQSGHVPACNLWFVQLCAAPVHLLQVVISPVSRLVWPEPLRPQQYSSMELAEAPPLHILVVGMWLTC